MLQDTTPARVRAAQAPHGQRCFRGWCDLDLRVRKPISIEWIQTVLLGLGFNFDKRTTIVAHKLQIAIRRRLRHMVLSCFPQD